MSDAFPRPRYDMAGFLVAAGGLGFLSVGRLPLSSLRLSVRGWAAAEAARPAMDEGGLDSEGKTYNSREQMWREEAGFGVEDSSKRDEWYHKGIAYWEGIDATVDGVLGGYGKVSSRDVVDSRSFLLEVMKEQLGDAKDEKRKLVALDCGAGVGRVTKNLLLEHFHEVDLVEPVKHFLEKARESLNNVEKPGTAIERISRKAVNFYCTPLQDFTPEPSRYDVIWVQWCVGHLTDDDFIAFFKRAQSGLKPGGFFVLKENISRHGFVVDKVDTSVTRSDAYFRDLFQRGGLHLLKTKLQKGFPRELFNVRMYAFTGNVDDVLPASSTRPGSSTKKNPKVISKRPALLR